MNREDYRHLLLSGTVTFPATLPNTGLIKLVEESVPEVGAGVSALVEVTETVSPRVTIQRKLLATNVRAIFIPRDRFNLRFDDGEWYLGKEIEFALRHRQLNSCQPTYGIVYVAENEPSLLVMRAGMTAAESTQYYPPLPCDRSNNHYNASPEFNYPVRQASGWASGGQTYSTDCERESLRAQSTTLCEEHDVRYRVQAAMPTLCEEVDPRRNLQAAFHTDCELRENAMRAKFSNEDESRRSDGTPVRSVFNPNAFPYKGPAS